MAEHESSLAVLVDFENMARPGAKGRGDFDIHLVLNRLAEKGRVLVKRAYADWSRYRDARHELMNAGLGLIEMPSAREGAKNRADIQMAVDAMELAYSREHVNNFVIVSGDSDFTPLVGKLRELNKRVIGVGNRESASELLIANCDEFIFYDLLAARASGAPSRRGGGGGAGAPNPVPLLQETLMALQREGVEWPLASIVKDSMRRKYPAFDETEHGFSTFSKFLEDAGASGIVRLETDPRSGTYRVELGEGRTLAVPPVPIGPQPGERTEDDGGGRRRRRRGGRRSAGGVEETSAIEGAEVFEVVITPTPDLELGTLPPLDEPISYEDMIMLGPEVDDELPDLVEATDVAAGEPPARSTRRRRRRGAGTDPEPTVADLEPVADDDTPPAADEAEADAPSEEAAAPARRRVRRAAAGAEPAEATTEATPSDAPAAEEEAPKPARRRRTTKKTADEAPAEVPAAEEPAAEEETPKPARRRRATAKAVEAEEAPAQEAPVQEAPTPARRRRATTKAAEEAPAEAVVADAPAAEEEAPKPARRRRTTKKAAEAEEPVSES